MRKFFAVVLFAVLTAFVVGCSSESGTSDVSSQNVAYTVSANKIYAEYKANEVKADAKYKDKVIVVTGKVTDIGKDIMDQPYLVVGGTGFLDGCQCTFADSAVGDISNVNKGDKVSVKGKVTGFLGMVEMEDGGLQ